MIPLLVRSEQARVEGAALLLDKTKTVVVSGCIESVSCVLFGKIRFGGRMERSVFFSSKLLVLLVSNRLFCLVVNLRATKHYL